MKLCVPRDGEIEHGCTNTTCLIVTASWGFLGKYL